LSDPFATLKILAQPLQNLEKNMISWRTGVELITIGDLPVNTWSEAIHNVLRRKGCPYIQNCNTPVTKDFFTRICNSSSYLKCHHFARRVGELNPPMTWLQHFALRDEKQDLEIGKDQRASNNIRS